MPKLLSSVLEQPEIVIGIPPRTRYDSVALDLEIFGADGRQLHRPRGRFGCLTVATSSKVYIVKEERDFTRAIQNVSNCRWYIHNGNFDVRHFRRWGDIPQRPGNTYRDTLIIEKLLWSGYYDSFSLADLSRRYLKVYMDKSARKRFSDGDEQLDDTLIKYAALDAWHTLQIGEIQESFLEQRPDALKVWEEVDCPAFWAVLDFKGIYIDQEKWKNLASFQAQKAEVIAAVLGFNPGSPKQVMEFLHGKGIKVQSTGEEVLLKYASDPYVADILAYRKAKKLSSSYGDGFAEKIEEDGRIYPSFNIFGAETGRMSSDGPNLQQIPHEAEYRECFTVPRGHSMLDADYSSQEMWIAAEISRDEKMVWALTNGDVYVNVAKDVYKDNTIEGKKHPLRRKAKSVALGALFGLTEYGLNKQQGIPLEEGADLFRRFFSSYPGIHQMIRNQHSQGQRTGYVSTQAGRRYHLNTYFPRWPNNAVNSPIQGTGAEMLKLAIIELHKKYGKDIPLIIPNHDELVADCPTRQAKQVKKDIETAMNGAFYKLCPNVSKGHKIAECTIGKTWADKD